MEPMRLRTYAVITGGTACALASTISKGSLQETPMLNLGILGGIICCALVWLCYETYYKEFTVLESAVAAAYALGMFALALIPWSYMAIALVAVAIAVAVATEKI
ncbi:hypothetical protein D2E26_0345 [Bifidobacterium dolichotidis]|uniref:Uncharacterized protein n=1 Tax=Bifidobacterium dolichotidis TaxID=2306976 RepID=A0A430FSB2_9BIFI|nr:hypothetical protein [Bifidobacterium dolichotidis]RSX55782.1 hypothetical protein D2E26_0345 [Bifidobacterium dolichotidis]